MERVLARTGQRHGWLGIESLHGLVSRKFLYNLDCQTAMTVEQRFMRKVKRIYNRRINSICWLWTGAKTPKGYGVFHVGGRKELAHRQSYKMFVGPIPAGREVDHFRCHDPSCVCPRHLRPATPLENTRNGRVNNAVKTHCKHGHEFTEVNTYRMQRRARNGREYTMRMCRTCQREAQAKRRCAA